jgi:hypothetical protein
MIQNLRRTIAPFVIGFFITACSQSNELSVLKQRCTGCHNLVPICNKLGKKGFEDWKLTIESMKRAGAKVSATDVERLADFLSRQTSLSICK